MLVIHENRSFAHQYHPSLIWPYFSCFTWYLISKEQTSLHRRKYPYYLLKLCCSVPKKEIFRSRAQIKWQHHNTMWNLFSIVSQMNRESEYGSKLAKHTSFESKFVVCQKLLLRSFTQYLAETWFQDYICTAKAQSLSMTETWNGGWNL